MAGEYMKRREQSKIGVSIVREWAQSLASGASIIDIGCGHGVPMTSTLINDGFRLWGIDASPNMVAAFRIRFPHVNIACETVEETSFFNRTFDAAVAIGLMFLLPPKVQRSVIHKVAALLNPGGRFLFTAPIHHVTWTDVLTGRTSISLGRDTYYKTLSDANLDLVDEFVDEGDNHYYSTRKPE